MLRVWGATPAGQRACMWVHGVYPYVYVPYGLERKRTRGEALRFCRALRAGAEWAGGSSRTAGAGGGAGRR